MNDNFWYSMAFILTMIASFSFGAGWKQTSQQEEAVENEVAEYYINEDNQKTFRYLECD